VAAGSELVCYFITVSWPVGCSKWLLRGVNFYEKASSELLNSLSLCDN